MRHSITRLFTPIFHYSPDPSGGTLPIPEDAPIIPPAPAPSGGHDHPADITCGFCGSSLTTSRGEVLRLGARAKTLRDSEHEIERLTRALDESRRECASLRPVPPPAPSEKKPFWQL